MNTNPLELPQAGAVIAILLLVGGGVKHFVPKIDNSWIPAITLVLGVGLYVLWTQDYSGLNIAEAFIIAWSATGVHSSTKSTIYEKMMKGKKDDIAQS